MQKIFTSVAACLIAMTSISQNISVNTDGTTGETGVMLDVKGTRRSSDLATQTVFQVKSFDASASALKMRLILGTNSTAGSRYGALDVYDAPNNAYRFLALQPSGGYVGIGLTNPQRLLHAYGIQSVLRLENSGTGAWAGIEGLTNNSTNNGYFGFKDTDGRFFIDADATSNSDDMVILKNGNVGMGTTSPTNGLLQVQKNQNALTDIWIENQTDGTASNV